MNTLRRQLTLISILGLLAGCGPAAARINAKADRGFYFEGRMEDLIYLNGRGADSSANNVVPDIPGLSFTAGLGLPVAANSAFQVSLKAPHQLLFTALDVYYQFPHFASQYLGIGVEAGVLSAAYFSHSIYWREDVFSTLTGRAGYLVNTRYFRRKPIPYDSTSRWFLGGQIAGGYEIALKDNPEKKQRMPLGIFAAYYYVPGEGLHRPDHTLDWFDFKSNNVQTDYRNHLIQLGFFIGFGQDAPLF